MTHDRDTERETPMDTARPTGPPTDEGDTPPEDVRAESVRAESTESTGVEPADRGIRVGTVVWGLVVAAIGIGLVATVAGVRFDVELAVIGLVAAAGLALLVGSFAKAARRR